MNIATQNRDITNAEKIDPADRHPYAKGGCRFCGTPLKYSVVDLGNSPLCESFLNFEELQKPEATYPLHAFVCDACFLVQVEEYVSGEEIFGGEYAYFSSYSTSWLEHAKKFADQIADRLKLDENSQVVELASNDGYLLTNFIEKGIPVLGIEPAGNVAKTAIEKGVPTVVKFFGVQTANELVAEGIQADLLCANNVLAHVPDLNDFVAGMKIVLKPTGVITVEFPHLMCMIELNQFDTIYQEHYCYYSLLTLLKVFNYHGMKIFDVEELGTHGGSLRIYAGHKDDATKPVSDAVTRIHQAEIDKGYDQLGVYQAYAEQVRETKRQFLEFLIETKRAGKQIAAYGAPGKGNTLLNYCGVRTDFIDYTVDRNPNKHGKYLPGTHIPIFDTTKIKETKPDYIVILPWNLKDEIAAQLEYTREWGAKLVVPIPQPTVF